MPNVVERRAHGVLRNARDPVCGMEVSVVHPNAQTEWRGVLYRFCSEDCQRRFERDADGFVARLNNARPAPDERDATDEPSRRQ